MIDVTVTLYNVMFEEDFELSVNTDAYVEFVDGNNLKDFFVVKVTLADDVTISFDDGEVSMAEFIRYDNKLADLREGDVAYIGAYNEAFTIGTFNNFIDLVYDGLYIYTFYPYMDMAEVADEILSEFNLPYFITHCIDYDLLQDCLVNDGYEKTEYGVIVR